MASKSFREDRGRYSYYMTKDYPVLEYPDTVDMNPVVLGILHPRWSRGEPRLGSHPVRLSVTTEEGPFGQAETRTDVGLTIEVATALHEELGRTLECLRTGDLKEAPTKASKKAPKEAFKGPTAKDWGKMWYYAHCQEGARELFKERHGGAGALLDTLHWLGRDDLADELSEKLTEVLSEARAAFEQKPQVTPEQYRAFQDGKVTLGELGLDDNPMPALRASKEYAEGRERGRQGKADNKSFGEDPAGFLGFLAGITDNLALDSIRQAMVEVQEGTPQELALVVKKGSGRVVRVLDAGEFEDLYGEGKEDKGYEADEAVVFQETEVLGLGPAKKLRKRPPNGEIDLIFTWLENKKLGRGSILDFWYSEDDARGEVTTGDPDPSHGAAPWHQVFAELALDPDEWVVRTEARTLRVREGCEK